LKNLYTNPKPCKVQGFGIPFSGIRKNATGAIPDTGVILKSHLNEF